MNRIIRTCTKPDFYKPNLYTKFYIYLKNTVQNSLIGY